MGHGAEIIDVTFVDADTGQTFLQLKLPARQLPESFSAATTLNLGKDDWQVIEAAPVTAAEFVASRRLTLRMRKLQAIDPREILFSLPTVADVVPQVVPPAAGAPEPLLTLHEDDWLQLELVPEEVAERTQPDLDAIAKVLSTARKGPGFERLHIRKALPAPFSHRVLEVAALQRRFGAGGAIAAPGGVLEGGFAFGLPGGGVLYGQSDGPRVSALGLRRREDDAAELMRDERLVLVDWVAARRA